MTKEEVIEAVKEGSIFISQTFSERSLDTFADFLIENGYKIKPKYIIINGFKVPAPVRDGLNIDARYFYVSLRESIGYSWSMFRNDNFDLACLKNGIVHLTKEAVEIHAKALLSFTAVKE